MIEKLFEILNPSKIDYNNLSFKTYGIFDGVKYPMLWSDLEEGVLKYDMLFREESLRKEMEKVAPYLVELDFDSESGVEQSKDLLEYYGQRGCIFLATPLGFTDILEKLLDVFYIYTPEGDKGFFRFYAPQIFTELVLQKDSSLSYTLFGKIYSYWSENLLDDSNIVQYKYNGEKLSTKNYLLSRGE